MTVKQISVFVENKPGSLATLTNILSKHDINMKAMSLAETEDFGIVRLIADDSYKTVCVLKEEGYVCSITPVLAVSISDEPGGLYKILRLLGDNEINLDYTYAFITRKKAFAYMILRVENHNIEKAIDVLSKNQIKLVSQDELYKL